ncbi:uncharacterized protein LOC132402625 [Hypanus sabinus]|uniref:uncharacterized protein LOC132402625 n=1 Tax=Hypanus sabinus TaxID=79690 RepID=UPI0028C3C086|nr:uncharacterized protein LOC132402625 [Hypanus sabinus]
MDWAVPPLLRYPPLSVPLAIGSQSLYYCVISSLSICLMSKCCLWISAWHSTPLSIVPQTLVNKLGLNTPQCNTVFDFPTNNPQVVKMHNHSSLPKVQNSGEPRGCVLSPLLYTPLTCDCMTKHPSNYIVKFTNDTTVGFITNNHETAYRKEVEELEAWCEANNLFLNVNKTKEMVIGFRRTCSTHIPLTALQWILRTVLNSWKCTSHYDLSRCQNTFCTVKKVHQHLYFLRRTMHICTRIILQMCSRERQNTLYHCMVQKLHCDGQKVLQWVKTTQCFTGPSLPAIMNIYTEGCWKRANNIMKDSSHPGGGNTTSMPGPPDPKTVTFPKQ